MIRLTRLPQNVPIVANDNASPELILWWQEVVEQIESSVNEIIAAQEAAAAAAADASAAQSTADGAQNTADSAAADAAAAQTTADTALGLAQTAVQQEIGPTWADATGTADRGAYAAYSAPTVSNPPTQAEVQDVADAVQNLSQHFVALINDLYANKALTNT